MAREPRKASETEGKPPETPSEESGQAGSEAPESEGTPSPQTDTVLLDATKKFSHPRHPEIELSGDEAWRLINRGQEYSRVQSERDKERAEREKVAQENAQLKAQLDAMQRRSEMMQTLKELGVQSGQKDTSDVWDEDTPPDMEQIASRIETKLPDIVGKRMLSREEQDQIITQRVREIYALEREGQEQQQRLKEGAEKFYAGALAGLQAQYPDIPEKDFKDVLRLEAEARTLERVADQKVAQGDQTFWEEFADAEAKRKEATERRVELERQQRKTNATRERDAELESLSAGSLLGEEEAEPRTPEYNWRRAREQAKERKSKAKRMIDRVKQIRGAHP